MSPNTYKQHKEPRKMSKQSNIFQMKKEYKAREKDFNKTEISNLPDEEFVVMIIKTLT